MLKLRKGRVELPEFFRIPLFEDVTDHYTPDYAEEVMIPDSLFTEKVAPGDVIYLCSLSRNIWRVEDYTVKGLFRARFNGVQTGNIVCAARMGEDGLTSVTEPFVVGKKPDEYVFFKPSRKKETVILKSKYHLEGDDGKYGEIMRNGVFEGSQTPDFQHPDTLAIIQSRPVRQTTRLNTYRQSVEPHKFVRYKGTYGSSSIAAEIGFYGHDGLPVEYDRILGVQSEKARRALAHAFDSDPSTSYSAEDGWCGLELSTPVHVHSVTFTPRNRVNYIYAGDEYELFYYHGSWISLGRMVADSDSLLYHNVPVGALLFLKNHTTGVNEMAFTYEDGIQNFLGYTDRNSRMESFPRVSEEDWSCSHTFLTPEDDWVTPLYDDSDWEIGLGPFGLKRGCRTEWSSRNLYVRYRFDMRSDSGAVSDHILKGQYTADSIALVVKGGGMEKASLMSNAFIAIQEDKTHHNQIKGAEMMAYFDEKGALKRFDVLGGANALFYLEENGALATVNKTDSKMLSATFKDGELQRVYYFEQAKNDGYPVVQLSGDELNLKGFSWQPEKRPVDRYDVTPLALRPSQRKSYEARPRATFVQTEIYFPGYIGDIYRQIEVRDSLRVVRERERAIAEKRAAERARLDSLALKDSLALADSLAISDSLALSDSLVTPRIDSLAVADSLQVPSDSLAVADSVAVAPVLTPEQIAAAEKAAAKKAAQEAKLKAKEEARKAREAKKKKKQEELEARWAELDKRDAEKQAAKDAKNLEKERQRKRKALERIARQEARDAATLEKYRQKYLEEKQKSANKDSIRK